MPESSKRNIAVPDTAHVRLVLALLAGAAATMSTGCGVVTHTKNAQGVALYRQGQYQAALQRFNQALYTDPNDADAYYNIAATYHRIGKLNQSPADLDQAESYYNQCLDHEPDHVDCYRGLAVMLVEQGRSEEAFRLMEGWVDRSPTSPEPKIELARLFEEFNDREAAKEHLLDALTVDPYNSRALAALGKLHEELGNPEQALANYQRSLSFDRFQPEVAARVAALRTTVGPTITAPGGTRVVTTTPSVFTF